MFDLSVERELISWAHGKGVVRNFLVFNHDEGARALLSSTRSAIEQVEYGVFAVGDDDIRTRAAVEAQVEVKKSAVVVQGELDQTISAGLSDIDHLRPFEIRPAKLDEALQLGCFSALTYLDRFGEHVQAAEWSSKLGIERPATYLWVVELPTEGVEVMLHRLLERTVEKGQLLQDQSNFTPIETHSAPLFHHTLPLPLRPDRRNRTQGWRHVWE
ncbi:hypothetical protein SDC9_113423 [bioreactor metagenome]|uniref:Uncharacterized protein n=1 Tax=bioreactor metagenome TaxID=1076179 RepID=A0A645BXS3_9ZZZZ